VLRRTILLLAFLATMVAGMLVPAVAMAQPPSHCAEVAVNSVPGGAKDDLQIVATATCLTPGHSLWAVQNNPNKCTYTMTPGLVADRNGRFTYQVKIIPGQLISLSVFDFGPEGTAQLKAKYGPGSVITQLADLRGGVSLGSPKQLRG